MHFIRRMYKVLVKADKMVGLFEWGFDMNGIFFADDTVGI